MAMQASEIEQLIRNSFPDAEVVIDDLRGDGDHYAALVRSAAFRGKSRVQQHRLVHAALEERVGTTLHALAITTEAL
jgi:stress-induced morphogen